MNRLKELRKEKKYTQAQIAELMGVNVKTISRWEKGEFEIKPLKLKCWRNISAYLRLIF